MYERERALEKRSLLLFVESDRFSVEMEINGDRFSFCGSYSRLVKFENKEVIASLFCVRRSLFD
jgi:hypothetical protein